MSICSKCNRHYYYMEIAGDVAKNSTSHYLHGCVIVKGGVIISTGYNNYSKGKYRSIHSMHAEMDAIKNLKEKEKLRGASLYVVRISERGFCNSKPCIDCTHKLIKIMNLYGLGKVYYS